MATVPTDELCRDAIESSKVEPLQHQSMYFSYFQYEVVKFRKVVTIEIRTFGI